MFEISGDTKINELINQYPHLAEYLIKEYQFHCVGCFISDFENLVDGARVHGIVDADFDQLLIELNELAQKGPSLEHTSPLGNGTESELIIVGLNGGYLLGAGVSDYLALFAAIQRLHHYAPKQFIEAFNELLPLYYRAEIKQVDFWEMVNEKHETNIDSQRNWFDEFYRPQINTFVKIEIAKLKNSGKKIIGVLNTGVEQAEKLEKLDFSLFERVYRSDQTGSSKQEYRFWQEILAHEKIPRQKVVVVESDKKVRALTKELDLATFGSVEDFIK